MRQSFDQLYDGGRTGVYSVDQLSPTQKTHLGTFVEINMAREFDFETVGVRFDYRIAGHDVDAKFSLSGEWMLPPEVFGSLCLVMEASDKTATFKVGVLRANGSWLRAGGNRDTKVSLRAEHRDKIAWIHRNGAMPPNVLASLPPQDLQAILSRSSGQQKVNEVFRRAPGLRISRAAIETLAMQKDPMKRVRRNGGARSHLSGEGIVIMGGDYVWQREVARALGVEPPQEGEFVSLYITKADPTWAGPQLNIGGESWRLGERAEARATASEIPEVLQEAGKAGI